MSSARARAGGARWLSDVDQHAEQRWIRCHGPGINTCTTTSRPITMYGSLLTPERNHFCMCQAVTTPTSPMPRASTGAWIWAASPTRIVTRRSSGNAATTAAVASAVPVCGQARVELGLVVVRQVLLHLIGQRARDRRRRLVPQRRDADQVLHRHVALRRRSARPRPACAAPSTGRPARAGGLGVHRAADGQQRRARSRRGSGAGRPQHLLGGADPVGVALLLAQHPVQPGRERAAQAVRADRPAPARPRSCRSGPVRPISSWVWTAPGRSTMTTRPVSSAVDRRPGSRPAVSPVQPPRVSASTASRSTPVRSPTTTAVAVAGRTCAW